MKSDEFNASTEWHSLTNSRVNGWGQRGPDTDQQHTRRISKLFVVEIIVLLAKWRLIYLKLLSSRYSRVFSGPATLFLELSEFLHLSKSLWSSLGTGWELAENSLRTHWEPAGLSTLSIESAALLAHQQEILSISRLMIVISALKNKDEAFRIL